VEERFVKGVLAPEPSDRLLVAPVFSVDVEIFEKGILRRPTYRFSRLWIDGLTGRELPLSREPKPDEGLRGVQSVPPKLTAQQVLLAAGNSRCGAPEGWKGWGRYVSVHVRKETLALNWRLLLLRDGRIFDDLTGDEHELGLLASFFRA